VVQTLAARDFIQTLDHGFGPAARRSRAIAASTPFASTNLAFILRPKEIDVAFLTNCCVEATMRSAATTPEVRSERAAQLSHFDAIQVVGSVQKTSGRPELLRA